MPKVLWHIINHAPVLGMHAQLGQLVAQLPGDPR